MKMKTKWHDFINPIFYLFIFIIMFDKQIERWTR